MRDQRFISRRRGSASTITLRIEQLEKRDVPATNPARAGLVGGFAVDKVRTFDYEAWRTTGIVFQQGVVRSPTTSPAKASFSAFQITLRYTDGSVTASQKAIFNQAAQRWSEVIVGD